MLQNGPGQSQLQRQLLLLFFIVTFVYNLASKYSTQWAFVPALGVGWLMFRGRIPDSDHVRNRS